MGKRVHPMNKQKRTLRCCYKAMPMSPQLLSEASSCPDSARGSLFDFPLLFFASFLGALRFLRLFSDSVSLDSVLFSVSDKDSSEAESDSPNFFALDLAFLFSFSLLECLRLVGSLSELALFELLSSLRSRRLLCLLALWPRSVSFLRPSRFAIIANMSAY